MVSAPNPRSTKLWALADQSFLSATNFITMVLAARHLPVAGFAQFSLAYLAVLFATSFHRTLVTQPMNVLSAHSEVDLASRAAALWRAHRLLVPAGVVLVLAVSPLGFAEPWLMLSTSCYAAMFFLQEMQRRYAYTRFAIKPASQVSIVMGAVQLLSLYLLVFTNIALAGAWMAALATAQAAGIAVGYFWLRPPRTEAPSRQVIAVLREHFQHSHWVVASQLVYWASSQIYPFLVAGIGPAQTATFNAGMSVLNAANVLRMTLANYLPAQAGRIVSQHGEQALCAYARKLLIQLLIAGFCGWLILQLIAEPLIAFLFGSKFPEAVSVLRWVALGIWASMLSVVLNATALGLKQTRNIFSSNAAGAAFTLTAGIYLTHRFGLQGAIWANVIGYVLPMALQLKQLWPQLTRTSTKA